jgi:hypothetical protein
MKKMFYVRGSRSDPVKVDAAKLERRRERRLEKTIKEEWVKYMQVRFCYGVSYVFLCLRFCYEIRERRKQRGKMERNPITYIMTWLGHFVSYPLIVKELDEQANVEFREEKGEKQVASPIRACSRDTRQSHAAVQGGSFRIPLLCDCKQEEMEFVYIIEFLETVCIT